VPGSRENSIPKNNNTPAALVQTFLQIKFAINMAIPKKRLQKEYEKMIAGNKYSMDIE